VNKVISIEIARQVFWIEEQAYVKLQEYLNTIKNQLVNEEFADDIFEDIELRIAELLYNLGGSNQKAIGIKQLQQVIDQVGFMNSENEADVIPRRSYLDTTNKIIGGVCAGLSVRWGLSAFILRLVFIALGFVFGLGIVLYFIFWFSLEKNNNRNAALSAQGEALTAKNIAGAKPNKVNSLLKIQRIIFLPFSIFGLLISIITGHYKTRTKFYRVMYKSMLTLALLIVSVFVVLFVFKLNQLRLFHWSLNWLIGLSLMFLLSLTWIGYIRKYYQKKHQIPMDKRLKFTSILSVIILVSSSVYFEYETFEHQKQKITKSFTLQSNKLNLEFTDRASQLAYYNNIEYKIKTHDLSNQSINLEIVYSSEGRNEETANKNIQSIDYFFTFENNTLKLDSHWSLKEKTLNRLQNIKVLIEVPREIIIDTAQKIIVNNLNETIAYEISLEDIYAFTQYQYYSSKKYFHETDSYNLKRVSKNERKILEQIYCDEFFISEKWDCELNINTAVQNNQRFNHAFIKNHKEISMIGIRLRTNVNYQIKLHELKEIGSLVMKISKKDNKDYKNGQLIQYLRHLLTIKSKLEKQVEQEK